MTTAQPLWLNTHPVHALADDILGELDRIAAAAGGPSPERDAVELALGEVVAVIDRWLPYRPADPTRGDQP